MPRVKRGPKRKNRRQRILWLASGYYGAKSRLHRVAKLAVERSLVFAYRDRRTRRRDLRRLWIIRINAACRVNGLSYSQFIHGLNLAGVEVDRKVMADLAVRDSAAFGSLAAAAKTALAQPATSNR